MPDFSQFQKLDIPVTAKPYVFPELEGKVTVNVLPATEKNKIYFNALLKKGRRTSKAVQAGAINVNLIEDNRDSDRDLFAKYIIKGWENVTEKNGTVVPFTDANVLEFLNALPDHIFDGLRQFCGNYMNFVPDEEVPDVEGQSKNS